METDGKVALVTGASRGLGRAIALEFATSGYRVALAARSTAALEEVAREARNRGASDALVLSADLRTPVEPGRVVEETVAHFGRLDVLVNNAGDTKRRDFLELGDEDHLSGFALKYHGMVRACRAALPHLTSNGAIINISGIGAHTPTAEFSIGGPVNSAMINFSKALADRCRNDGPRVNVVCPGMIITDRLAGRIQRRSQEKGISIEEATEEMRKEAGVSRFGEPADIARMVVFLASDAAAYVNGTTVTVDGGATPGI